MFWFLFWYCGACWFVSWCSVRWRPVVSVAICLWVVRLSLELFGFSGLVWGVYGVGDLFWLCCFDLVGCCYCGCAGV